MCRHRSSFLGCALLALGMLSVAGQAQPVPTSARSAVERLAADVAAGRKISDVEVKQFVARWNRVEEVMSAFKPTRIGEPSLETTLLALSGKGAYTSAEKAQLRRIAHLGRAVAIVLPNYHDKTKGDFTRIQDWDRFAHETNLGSTELLRALNAGEDRTIQRRATKLAASCTDCHGAFRWWSSEYQKRRLDAK